MNKKQKKRLARIIASAGLMILLHFVAIEGLVKLLAYLAVYLLIGYDVLSKAWKGIRSGQVFDENFLMAIATVGAFVLGISSGSGDYSEAVAVMLFYQIGELFQSYATGKSRKNISELMELRPDYANIEVDGELEQVDPEDIEIGSVIIVNPGEKVPIDGTVVEGESTLNMAALTGESLPQDIFVGDSIVSGSINLTGVLKIRTDKMFEESTVSKILDLVENSGFKKAKSEKFIGRFARIYTPAVCYAALALAFLPPLVCQFFLGMDANWSEWIYKALTFLVISCPCALVISVPLSFFCGIGGAGKEGILVKGAEYLETLSKADCVVFDKTGTLTQGVFEVQGVHHSTIENEKLIEYAAIAECASSHPISLSLRKAHGKALDRSRVEDIKEISGKGIIAKVDGKEIAVGNDKLMTSLGIQAIDCRMTGTIIHIAIDGEYSGHIVISDVVKKTSVKAIKDLKKAGVKRVIMLTGDRKEAAEEVAKNLEITELYSELLPQDKVEKTEELIQSEEGKLIFVGDGMNDAPVLSRADVGIAMGAMGSDAAIEAADVVLMDDDPAKISEAIRIAKKCVRIVYQNVALTIGVKIACFVLVVMGLSNMWLAVFADVGVMVIAVLNAVRAMLVKVNS